MTISYFRPAWGVFFVCVLAGCGTVKKAAQQFVSEPSVSLTGANVQDANLDGATFVFDLGVSNPNSFGLAFSNVTYQLTLNGHGPFSGQLAQGARTSRERLLHGRAAHSATLRGCFRIGGRYGSHRFIPFISYRERWEWDPLPSRIRPPVR